MQQIGNFIMNYKYITFPFMLWFLTQVYKVINDIRKYKKINPKRILGAGGMPSSHSACVTVLATIIGKNQGYDTPIFALAAVFAAIVMYDAAGVRRAAGKQAKVINKILTAPNLKEINIQEKLGELLGHTPLEVIVGATLGITVGLIFG